MNYKNELNKLDKNELLELLMITTDKLNKNQLLSIMNIIYDILDNPED